MITNPIFVGLAIGLPSSALGFLGYARARSVDRATAASGVASARSGELNLVVVGLNQLIDNLQEDNRTLREELKEVSTRLRAVTAECDELSRKLYRLERKYGENGS